MCWRTLFWFLPFIGVDPPWAYLRRLPLGPPSRLPPAPASGLSQSPVLSGLRHTANSRGLSLLHVVRLCLHAALSFVLASPPATVPRVGSLPLKQGRRAQCQGCPRPGVYEGAEACVSGPSPPATAREEAPAHSTPLRRRGDASLLIKVPRDRPPCRQGPRQRGEVSSAKQLPHQLRNGYKVTCKQVSTRFCDLTSRHLHTGMWLLNPHHSRRAVPRAKVPGKTPPPEAVSRQQTKIRTESAFNSARLQSRVGGLADAESRRGVRACTRCVGRLLAPRTDAGKDFSVRSEGAD